VPGDAVEVSGTVGAVDLAYLDPPYNQHPYGSNYFMLNLVVGYQRPERISRVSGIPPDWKRSAFNSRRMAHSALEEVIARLEARFILLSFNSEGFLHLDELMSLLSRYGKLIVLEKICNTFKGGRQAAGRSRYLREYLLVLEKA
jgi:adenine-specific DNA-methyltransferase